jgi:hypothetical protein
MTKVRLSTAFQKEFFVLCRVDIPRCNMCLSIHTSIRPILLDGKILVVSDTSAWLGFAERDLPYHIDIV